MAFVSVPKDLTKVKNKIIFNLTKRQLICFGIAAAVGVPFYFLTRGIIGSSNAATGMCLLMLPAFLFAMYGKDGLPLEKVLKNMIKDGFQYAVQFERDVPEENISVVVVESVDELLAADELEQKSDPRALK